MNEHMKRSGGGPVPPTIFLEKTQLIILFFHFLFSFGRGTGYQITMHQIFELINFLFRKICVSFKITLLETINMISHHSTFGWMLTMLFEKAVLVRGSGPRGGDRTPPNRFK